MDSGQSQKIQVATKKRKSKTKKNCEKELLRVSIELQQQYESANPKDRSAIFESQISKRIDELAQDKYLHYVLLQVLRSGPPDQKSRIFHVVNLKKTIYWKKKYAYKLILEALSDQECQERPQLITFIMKSVDLMKYDQYGNLVLGHLISQSEDKEQFRQLINMLTIDKIKFHQYGCLVLIKILERNYKCSFEIQKIVNEVIDELSHSVFDLTKSDYSNYLIQKLLLNASIEQNTKILNTQLLPRFLELAVHKSGSNVCEKMIEIALAYQLQYLWTKFIKSNFLILVNDKFANYVMQTYFLHVQLLTYIRNEFVQMISELNQQAVLTQNGLIVFRYATQFNQVGERSNPQP